MDSVFLVDAFPGGVDVFPVELMGGMLVVVVLMCIKSVYLSYDTTNEYYSIRMYRWKFEEIK